MEISDAKENLPENSIEPPKPNDAASDTSSSVSDSDYEIEKEKLEKLIGNEIEEEENEDLKSVSSKFSTIHEKPPQPPATDGLETNTERIGYYSSNALEKARFREAGKIESVSLSFLTVNPVHPLLNLDALLFILPSPNNPILLGPVDDVFGQITLPKYSVIPDSFLKKKIEEGEVKKGDKVFCEEGNSKELTIEAVAEMKKRKGCDGSNAFDEEVGDEEREFSDDEEETARKHKGKIGKKRVEAIREKNFESSSEEEGEMMIEKRRNNIGRRGERGGGNWNQRNKRNEYYSDKDRRGGDGWGRNPVGYHGFNGNNQSYHQQNQYGREANGHFGLQGVPQSFPGDQRGGFMPHQQQQSFPNSQVQQHGFQNQYASFPGQNTGGGGLGPYSNFPGDQFNGAGPSFIDSNYSFGFNPNSQPNPTFNRNDSGMNHPMHQGFGNESGFFHQNQPGGASNYPLVQGMRPPVPTSGDSYPSSSFSQNFLPFEAQNQFPGIPPSFNGPHQNQRAPGGGPPDHFHQNQPPKP